MHVNKAVILFVPVLGLSSHNNSKPTSTAACLDLYRHIINGITNIFPMMLNSCTSLISSALFYLALLEQTTTELKLNLVFTDLLTAAHRNLWCPEITIRRPQNISECSS